MAGRSIIEFSEQEYEAVRNIPGISELTKATNDWDVYYWTLQDYLNNSEGEPPQRPYSDLSTLCHQFPLASAYIDAKRFSLSSNQSKAAAGVKAMEMLISGADPTETITAMNDAWKRYCIGHR